MTTTLVGLRATITHGGHAQCNVSEKLLANYAQILKERRLFWATHHQLKRKLGAGGQGVVYLSERKGADDFTLPVAIKVFSPERFATDRSYDEAMQRMGRVSSQVARISHDNLLDVQNFVDRNRIRMMVMEWIDGFDLEQLLQNEMLERVEHRLSRKRWEYINRVIVTRGPSQPRFKAGVAVAIVRDCLAALGALHRENLIHGDIKPSNIMLKRTGVAKIVDVGSAFEIDDPPAERTCTPIYAAPEVLDGRGGSRQSDLASVGYVLIELLSGQCPFPGQYSYAQLLEAKRELPHRLEEILPAEVTVNELLMNFCRRLVAIDDQLRYETAEEADLEGASAFHRQLVLGNMASEYENEIRLWIEELKEMEE